MRLKGTVLWNDIKSRQFTKAERDVIRKRIERYADRWGVCSTHDSATKNGLVVDFDIWAAMIWGLAPGGYEFWARVATTPKRN